jgi:hypothetical protein
VCGALMIFGGLLGFWMIDPERSARSVRGGEVAVANPPIRQAR